MMIASHSTRATRTSQTRFLSAKIEWLNAFVFNLGGSPLQMGIALIRACCGRLSTKPYTIDPRRPFNPRHPRPKVLSIKFVSQIPDSQAIFTYVIKLSPNLKPCLIL
jgi:hypothetical protein